MLDTDVFSDQDLVTSSKELSKFVVRELRTLVEGTGLVSKAMASRMKKDELVGWYGWYAAQVMAVREVVADERRECDVSKEEARASAALTSRYRAYDEHWRGRVLELEVENAQLRSSKVAHQSWLVYLLHDKGAWIGLNPSQREGVLTNIDDEKMREFMKKFGGARVMQPFGSRQALLHSAAR